MEEDLQETFNEKNFPKVTLPKIKKNENAEATNQSDVLEEWLAEVMKKPLLITKPIIKFLNISEESSAPFITYFEVSYRSFCSNTFMLFQLKKKEVKNNRMSLVGYAGEETETSTNNASTKINALMKEKL